MSLDDPAKIAEALERLEQERERRIAAKVEAGQAIVVKLCAPATQDIAARKAHKLAELRSAGERREVIFNTLVFNTGVPRAGRDDDAATDNVPAAPNATKSDTARAPFPNRYEPLAESLPKSPPPRPAARVPDMTEARPIKATIRRRTNAIKASYFLAATQSRAGKSTWPIKMAAPLAACRSALTMMWS